MTTPVSTRILDNMVTALEGITTINGYWRSVQSVGKADLFVPDWKDVDLPALLVGAVRETAADGPDAGDVGETDWTMIVGVLAAGGPRGDSDGWAQDEMAEMKGAIVKAVMTDYQRGGLAIWTKPTEVEYRPETLLQFDAAIAVTFEILYRTRYADLTQGA